jgi:aspartyl-tRNA(Asn)/glutamyl-tRNA(Gln) amidotransferase subunit B
MKYFPIIGLEIHCELKTRTKMFCACLNDPNQTIPNKNICPLCTGQPGSLPVPNKKAIEYTIKAGLALNCQISSESKFDRKNYYYPDLPKGYQISQFDKPFCFNGFLKVGLRKIRIKRIHLEEDTAKLLHYESGGVGSSFSLIDFNRSGVPLLELVTEADIVSGWEASEMAKWLQVLFKKYLQISDADMEKGQMRVEANISLSTQKDPKNLPNYKVEIKNLNSFKAVREAIDFEIKRQQTLLSKGKAVKQETRGWDEDKKETFPQRFKEQAEDYRYFPEPDIPPIIIKTGDVKADKPQNFIDLEKIKKSLPQLPWQRKDFFISEYNLSEKEADFFVFEKELGDYFEAVIANLQTFNKNKEVIKLAANYIISRLQSLILNESEIRNSLERVNPKNFAKLVDLIYQGKISSTIAQTVLQEMLNTGADPDSIIESKSLSQISDSSLLESVISEVVNENQKAVADFKAGKKEILMFLVGQVMKKTSGKANPKIAQELLLKKLS